MMKFLICLALSSALFLGKVERISACAHHTYSPGCYFTYRVDDDGRREVTVEQNCLQWQQLTGKEVPLESIRELVYERDLWSVEKNDFMEWLVRHQDIDALACLHLAKQCEYFRAILQKDPWYYACDQDTVHVSLSRIAEKAQAYEGRRLKDRYTLQAVRALFSLRRYEECIRLWERRQDSIPEGVVKEMTLPYIAGCYYRTGDRERAVALYAACGDMKSLFHCLGDSVKGLDRVGRMRWIRRYNPRCTHFLPIVAQMIAEVERWEDPGDSWEELEGLYRFSVELAQDRRTSNRGAWFYTAAFLADKLQRPAETVLSYIRLAGRQKSSAYLQESIRVLEIYLSTKYAPSMSGHEERLMRDLKEMERLLLAHLTPEVIQVADESGHYKMPQGYSFYYWNDMLRKLLLSVVAPGYLKEGDPVRAIQVVNMADNLLLLKIREREPSAGWMARVRKSTQERNPYDYRNHLFKLLDTTDVRYVVEYLERVHCPLSELDRYLNRRGYTDTDFFYDLIGTKYLYQSDYDRAVAYLERVTAAFQYTLNTFKGGYMRRDPFQPKTRLADGSDYKLNFAREMQMLRRQIRRSADPDRKAQLQIRYATGMRNSFGPCWALTQYRSSCEDGKVLALKKRRVKEEYDRLIRNALEMFTDPEAKALAYWRLERYKTVAEEYPDTKIADFVRTHCDRLRDYFP